MPFQNPIWYICATEGLKIGGLGSGPLLKMGGLTIMSTCSISTMTELKL